jgi:hypothetical protein
MPIRVSLVWDESFAVPGESRGIGYDPNTYVGREMIKLKEELEREYDDA